MHSFHFLSIYTSDYLPFCLSLLLSTFLSIYTSAYLSVHPSILLPIYLLSCLTIYLSIYLYLCLSIYLSIYILFFSIFNAFYQTVYQFDYLFIYLHMCSRSYTCLRSCPNAFPRTSQFSPQPKRNVNRPAIDAGPRSSSVRDKASRLVPLLPFPSRGLNANLQQIFREMSSLSFVIMLELLENLLTDSCHKHLSPGGLFS